MLGSSRSTTGTVLTKIKIKEAPKAPVPSPLEEARSITNSDNHPKNISQPGFQQESKSLLSRGDASSRVRILSQKPSQSSQSDDAHQASEEILKALERYALAKGKVRCFKASDNFKDLKSYLTAPGEGEHRSDKKIAARQVLAKIFIITKDSEQVTVSYRQGQRPETAKQFNEILGHFRVVDKEGSLTSNLEQIFRKHSVLQKTAFVQEEITSKAERYRRAINDARHKGIESKSAGDYGNIKKNFRLEYLNYLMDPSSSQPGPALQEFTDYVLKTQAVYDRAQKKASAQDKYQLKPGKSSLAQAVRSAFGLANSRVQGEDYLKEINNAGRKYNSQLSATLNTLTPPNEAINAIIHAAQKGEFAAGKHFDEHCLKNELDKKASPFQSVTRIEDIVLPAQYEKSIKNTACRVMKNIILKTAQEFDNSLAESLGEGIRDFNLDDAVTSVEGTDNFQINNSDPFIKWHNTFFRVLTRHEHIQQKFVTEVSEVSERLLPGDEQQPLREEIANTFSAIQTSNRKKLRDDNHQRLTDIRNDMFAKDVKILFDEARARTELKDKLRAAIPQAFKEFLGVQGSSVTANTRVQDAMDQYHNKVIAVGNAIVEEHIQTARAERKEAQDTTKSAASLCFQQNTNEKIKKEALQLARSFVEGLPHMKTVAEKSKAALIETPRFIKTLLKPFSNFTSALKSVLALSGIVAGIAAIVIPAVFGGALAAIGIILTGPIMPLIGAAAIVAGILLLIPGYISIFNERAEMQKINASTRKLIKKADEAQANILRDIGDHMTTYAHAVFGA